MPLLYLSTVLSTALSAALSAVVHTIHERAARPCAARLARATCHAERGQATTEYALVLLGAATLALLVVAWAVKTNKVGRLLDAVFDSVIKKVT